MSFHQELRALRMNARNLLWFHQAAHLRRVQTQIILILINNSKANKTRRKTTLDGRWWEGGGGGRSIWSGRQRRKQGSGFIPRPYPFNYTLFLCSESAASTGSGRADCGGGCGRLRPSSPWLCGPRPVPGSYYYQPFNARPSRSGLLERSLLAYLTSSAYQLQLTELHKPRCCDASVAKEGGRDEVRCVGNTFEIFYLTCAPDAVWQMLKHSMRTSLWMVLMIWSFEKVANWSNMKCSGNTKTTIYLCRNRTFLLLT